MARGFFRKTSFWKTVGAFRSQWKRALKRFFLWGYGKKGMGYIKNPTRAVKNKIYKKTTFSWNNSQVWIHLLLFFTTAGIGNIIYLLCKKR